jgi:GxxExxY protein
MRFANDGVTGQIIGGGMEVHSALGPGLLESAYEPCFVHELECRGLRVRRQIPLRITYRGIQIKRAYRIDLLVEESVLVEIKAVTTVLPIHKAQLLSYLKLSGYKVGLLINFHSLHLKDGIIRIVNRL